MSIKSWPILIMISVLVFAGTLPIAAQDNGDDHSKTENTSIFLPLVSNSENSVPIDAANQTEPAQLDHATPLPSGGSELTYQQPTTTVDIGPYPEAPTNGQTPTTNAAVSSTFEGFGFDDNSTETGSVFIPPDPSGAAGIDRLISVVNVMIEARDKVGNLLWRDSLKDFFSPLGASTLGTFTFDPKVVYDHYENRFVVVTLERVDGAGNPNSGNQSRILLAVSKTASPATATGADWEYHAIDSEISIGGLDYWADYPGFEVDEEAIYITTNMFSHIRVTTFFRGKYTLSPGRVWW